MDIDTIEEILWNDSQIVQPFSALPDVLKYEHIHTMVSGIELLDRL